MWWEKNRALGAHTPHEGDISKKPLLNVSCDAYKGIASKVACDMYRRPPSFLQIACETCKKGTPFALDIYFPWHLPGPLYRSLFH